MKKSLLLIITLLFCCLAFAQNNIAVKGKVLESETNEPLIGVTVEVKGTTQGTVTSIDGDYTLTFDLVRQ